MRRRAVCEIIFSKKEGRVGRIFGGIVGRMTGELY